MKKIILIPDSFKGTMSSTEICEIMSSAIRRHFPNVQIVSIPVADGGEGSVDAFLSAMGGEKRYFTVKGPLGCDTNGFYGLIDDKKTAVIEMAAAAGLPLAGDTPDVLRATTYGVGELMLDAARNGVRKIIMGLGGSATNDGGTGAAAACGIKFYDKFGNAFIPTGGTLQNIAHIDQAEFAEELKNIEIVTMCDIDNPLYGKNGAAEIFAPQKGAHESEIQLLDDGLRNLSDVIKSDLNIDVSAIKGAGAAGGMGAGMCAFFASTLEMGIETVLDSTGFDELLPDTDMVICGEGRFDSQSMRGKVISGVAKRIGNVPLIAVVGDIGMPDESGDTDEAYAMGVTAIFSINRVAVPFSAAKLRAKHDLLNTVDNIMRLLKL